MTSSPIRVLIADDQQMVRQGFTVLLGMRERAAMLGGALSAHPSPDGGYLVSAYLPAYPRLDGLGYVPQDPHHAPAPDKDGTA
ncbi:hypothetical protein AB0C98_24015 [Streptomyces sp. NPDC048558]|uniref:hypothetical protein n=1 Tax=Streptomyces sp. NPDC048558 TaxID=3155759 RepID=UPI003434DF72